MLETFENQLQVIVKHVFSLLQESSSCSRALAKDAAVDDP
jgi:hypothetical protein